MSFNSKEVFRHIIHTIKVMKMNSQITFKFQFVAFMVLALSLTSVQNLKAQEKRESTPAATQVIDQEKDRRVDIPSENLPETISEDLLDNYKDAQIIKSWKWVNDEGEIVKYEVQLDKQGQDLRLKYDTEGKPMTLRKEKK